MTRRIPVLLAVLILALLGVFSASADDADLNALKDYYQRAKDAESTISEEEALKIYQELVNYYNGLEESIEGKYYSSSEDYYLYALGRILFSREAYPDALDCFERLVRANYTSDHWQDLEFYEIFSRAAYDLTKGNVEKALSGFVSANTKKPEARSLCGRKIDECEAILREWFNEACAGENFERAEEICKLIGDNISTRTADDMRGLLWEAQEISRQRALENTQTVTVADPFETFCEEVRGGKTTYYITRNAYRIIYNLDLDEGNRKDQARMITMDHPTGTQLAIQLTELPFFKAMGLSNEQKVNVLYDVLLDHINGRNQEYYDQKHNLHIQYLNAGMSVKAVLKEMLATPEFAELCRAEALQVDEVVTDTLIDQNPGVTLFIDHCYWAALNRPASQEDLIYNIERYLNKELTMEDILMSFVLSGEVSSRNLSNEDYIWLLYRTMLGRKEIEDQEMSARLNELANGVGRDQMAWGIVQSIECAEYLDRYRLTEAERAAFGGSRLHVYEEAKAALAIGDYRTARDQFRRIPGYLDSTVLEDYCGTMDFCRNVNPNVRPVVNRAYDAIYHMSALDEGVRYDWARSIADWGTNASVAESFISYPVFYDPVISNRERVRALYSILLGRSVNPVADTDDGIRYVWFLDAGMSARAVAHEICNSDAYVRKCAEEGANPGMVEVPDARDWHFELTSLVSRCYLTALQRPAGPEELNYWCSVYFESGAVVHVLIGILCSGDAQAHLDDEGFIRTAFQLMTNQGIPDGTLAELRGILGQGRDQVIVAITGMDVCRNYLAGLQLN